MGLGRAALLTVSVLAVFLGYKLHSLLEPPPLPKLENDTWWGPGTPNDRWKNELLLTPYNITVSEEELQDLKWRLENYRPLTPPLEGIQQQYGMNTKLLQEVVEYWKTEYNWTDRQEFLNQHPQYLLSVQGLNIHVVHRNSKTYTGIKIVPILMLHGWPGSVREFFEVIPILTTPQKGRKYNFEVIAPYLPGFGFSEAAVRPGLGPAQLAVVFKNLMNVLGFKKFYVQGGDFGAVIAQHIAVLYPETILGVHSNMCYIQTPKSFLRTMLSAVFPSWYVRPEHYNRMFPLSEYFSWQLRETGYMHLQATKPDTLGVAMNDSPIGLAAYILEKFTTGTNMTWQLREDGGLKEYFSYRDLLDNIMIYWASRSATTSFRLYAETFSKDQVSLGIPRLPVQVPSACARFSYDFYTPDGFLSEVYPILLQLTDYEGGHFAAFQLPEVFANDLYDAIDKFEEYNKNNRERFVD